MTAPEPRVAGKLGCLPNDPAKPRLLVRDYTRPGLPSPPPAADWHTAVAAWPVYLNDRIGDCTCAEVGHQIESASTYGQGITAEVADADVLALYELAGGYVPGDPTTDQGAMIQDVLNAWRKTGCGGHQCVAFAELDITNLTEIRSAVADFGSADIGFVVYQGDMDAFNAGHQWDTTYAQGTELGGHSVEVAGYDTGGITLITWGHVQYATWDWWNSRVDEAWLVIQPEWLNTAGDSPGGLDLYQLGQALAQLTGSPNPIPPPAPVPVAQPPSPADLALWNDTAGAWCAEPRTRHDLVALKAALEAWAAAHGLT